MSTTDYLGYLDELASFLLACVAFADFIFNRKNRSRYVPLLVVIFILFCYVLYSIAIGSNGIKYILLDFVIQIKSFLAFLVVYAIAPIMNSSEKKIISVISVINIVAVAILLLIGEPYIEMSIGHIANGGIIIFLNILIFMFCNLNEDNSLFAPQKIIVVISLLAGLMCTRSKYYGECIFLLFMLFLYKPGMMRSFKFKHLILVLLLFSVIGFAVWNKFSYYFIGSSMGESFDSDFIESMARPALYYASGEILIDYIPFGSGLASFATYASYANYSDIYFQYGLNNVWGLSPEMPDFICDAFYAELAQFGIVGIILFIYFWYWAYGKIKPLIQDESLKYVFIVGASAFFFILVECTTGTAFIRSSGVIVMMILGFVTAIAKEHKMSTIKNKNI
ncbi:MAG: hypothetical protein IKW83_01445 [Muribaculaceae bacterium]|nr:hypothetical protein [Muribaculaceae bacterium]